MDASWHLTLIPTSVRVILIDTQVCKWVKIYIFRLSYKLTSDDLWPWFVIFDCMNIGRFPYNINKLSLVPIKLQLLKWGKFYIFSSSYNVTLDELWPWYMTFDCMNIWRFPNYINTPSWVPISLRLFKWDHFHHFSLSYNLTSDDLWPWHVTFDLIKYEDSHVAFMTQFYLKSIKACGR